jgi:uncharacterized membrane protein SpoIIM required for sporulation/uncharacterized RDD family membrane protein YckC
VRAGLECVYASRRGFFAALARLTVRIRRSSGHAGLVLGAFVLALGVAVGWALVDADPERLPSSAGLAGDRGPHATTEALREVLYYRVDAADELTAFAVFLFTHNTAVGVLAFAVGVLAGLPTGLLLFHNGLMVGALSSVYASRGLGLDLWAWLLPHGVPELTAIALCGAAGFLLAQGLLFPGTRTRVESLALRGREAAVLVLGAAVLLVVAGFVEGVLRQVVMDPAVLGSPPACFGGHARVVPLRPPGGRVVSRRVTPLARSDDGTRGTPVQVVTPEGVPLVFHAAPLGDRFVAVLIDLGCQFGILLAVVLLFSFVDLDRGPTTGALVALLLFGLRFGYFTTAELRRRGSTFGKRRTGLRVVDAAGGPLTAEAVLVRNLLRDRKLHRSGSPWAAVRWASLRRDRAMARGHVGLRLRFRASSTPAACASATCSRAPRRRRPRPLLDDVAPAAPRPARAGRGRARRGDHVHRRATRRLRRVSVQVLEDVLRRSTTRPGARAVRRRRGQVACVGWEGGVGAAALPFLRAYYAALRARLEHRRLLGRVKADQHDRGPRPGR